MNEGKKDRRDPIRTIKAKNPVAKNANKAIGGGAAGPMKDKKKAEKKGEVKHKKKEVAESYEDRLTQQLNELSIDSLKNYKAKRQTQQDAAKAATPNPRTGDKDWIDQAVRGINMNTAQRKINRKEKAVGEDIHGKSPFELGAADAYYGRNFIHQVQGYGFEPGTPDFSEYVSGWHSEDGKDGKDYGNPRPGPVHARRITKTSEAMNGITGPGMMRDPAMEDEGDAEGLPHLTAELAQHIADQIDTEGAHAIVKSVEWGDGAAKELTEFIKAALLKLAGVGMKEGSALDQHRQRSATADANLAKREAERKKNPGAASGDRIKELEKRYPAKEGWTHDSLADRLFEHERTYEEQLQSRLNKSLGK